MKFSEIPIANAEESILAHTTRCGGETFRKGRQLSLEDCQVLSKGGVNTVVAAVLEPGDVREDEAAQKIASAAAGTHVSLTAAFTGRCNIKANLPGLVRIDVDAVNRINAIDESVTIATLPDYAKVGEGQTVATIKIIPFSIEGDVFDKVLKTLKVSKSLVFVEAFSDISVCLINTTFPSLKETIVHKTTELTKSRIGSLGGKISRVFTCAHQTSDVADTLRSIEEHKPDLIVIVGASVTVDRGDVVPAGIVQAGGEIEHFGMPVDPGNLMLLARHQNMPVLVLPGCARSPKLNGIDWILERFSARLPVTSQDIAGLGVGGLLVDSPMRPLPRDQAVQKVAGAPAEHSIGAVILAAGQSRRMGSVNKLLEPIAGLPMIRRTVEAALSSGINSVTVVTGYEAEKVRDSLAGLNVNFVHNEDFADGLSTSLKTGLAAVPDSEAGAIVCLGDMPQIESGHINALISQFDPGAGRSIGVPVHRGKRGNPILWARQFFIPMVEISGDVGARHLIGANAELVYEVEFEDTAVLTDLDTPEEWAQYRKTEISSG